MRSSQRESCDRQVIESRVKPRVRAVARLAIRREIKRLVIRRQGTLKILGVAGEAISRKTCELPARFSFVAVRALRQRVRAQQWEAIRMLRHLLGPNVPTFHRVALLATGSELPSMQIRMAVGAFRAYVAEDKARVAESAVHLLVHSEQGIARSIVVKFRDGSDRFPADARVAIFTGNED